jgi:cytochrome c-type biogenesis protein CcmH/NrfF
VPSRPSAARLIGDLRSPTPLSRGRAAGPAVRRWLPVLLLVLLATVVVVGLAQGPPSPEDRAGALAARLRCPDCQSISVAESDSQTARAIREEIGRMVADGRSDQQVLDYFVARYGRWVLQDPPPRGTTLLVWLLPLAGLAAGVGALASYHHRARRRATPRARAGAVTEPPGTAAPTGADPAVGEDVDAEPALPPTRPRRRIFAITLIVVAILGATGFTVTRALVPRPAGGYVTGIEATGAGQSDQVPAGGRDLSKVSDAELEAVVAANPDVAGMRLALAHRYFDRRDYRRALEHYKAVLDRQPDPEALSHLGWITFAAIKRADLAAELLERSLERQPNDPEALWFLANVQLYGLKDAGAAVGTLTRLGDLPGLSGSDRRNIDGLLRKARAATEPP